MAAKRTPAADRTVDMFAALKPPDEREVEVLEGEEKDGRKSMDDSADELRERAFKMQEWTTGAFGRPEAEGNEYRLSHRAGFYYLETLKKKPGMATSYGYVGLMVAEEDLFAVTKVLVEAVREKQKRDAK